MSELEYKGYRGSVEWSEEDGLYYGKVLNCGTDLVSYEGKTEVDLCNDFKDAVDTYIESKNNKH